MLTFFNASKLTDLSTEKNHSQINYLSDLEQQILGGRAWVENV